VYGQNHQDIKALLTKEMVGNIEFTSVTFGIPHKTRRSHSLNV